MKILLQVRDMVIMETPCFPAYLYVGFIWHGRPAANDTMYYYRDQDSALTAFLALCERFENR